MAATPLVVLMTSAVVASGLATLLVIVSISVDEWQNVIFNDAKMAALNESNNVRFA
jgi:hypothetical protein